MQAQAAQEIYGVIWIDNLLGPLTLAKTDRESAVQCAAGIRTKGADKVRDVHAVHVSADNVLTRLD